MGSPLPGHSLGTRSLLDLNEVGEVEKEIEIHPMPLKEEDGRRRCRMVDCYRPAPFPYR